MNEYARSFLPADVTKPNAPVVLEGVPESAVVARRYVRQTLREQVPDVGDSHLDDVVLVASELVSNAIRYGTEPGDSFALTVTADDVGTRVEVRDPIRRYPRRRPESSERQRGRGLFILDALCPQHWGSRDTPLGKTVWAEVPR
ncbi:ATP-binding protein [Streptomyces sp. NPDC047046]|uniref:ATP-binding protein n=1 Tax=Streptomyces sp. NPDC047046 TaxID=3155378 RepID=UPI0033F37D49